MAVGKKHGLEQGNTTPHLSDGNHKLLAPAVFQGAEAAIHLDVVHGRYRQAFLIVFAPNVAVKNLFRRGEFTGHKTGFFFKTTDDCFHRNHLFSTLIKIARG